MEKHGKCFSRGMLFWIMFSREGCLKFQQSRLRLFGNLA